MAEGPKKLRDLVQEVFDERAQAASLSPEEIEAGVVELRRLFREIRERATTHRLVYEVVLRPGSYRLRFGNLKFRVILGKARRTSRIVVDATRDLLTADPGAWMALVTRGAENPSQIGITQGSASGTVTADDAGEEPRVLVEIHDFPAEQSVPVMELSEETAEPGSGDLIRVDPEILPERPSNGPGRPRT
jgi:hypothetical protein